MFHIEKVGDALFEAVTVDELKVHCRIYGSTDDAYLATLRIAARQQVEADLNMVIVGQQYKLYTESASSQADIILPISPVSSVDAITYLDTNDQRQTISSSLYRLKTWTDEPTIEFLDAVPAGDEVIVEFTAGFALVNKVPALVKHAIMFLVGHLYEHREAVGNDVLREVPQGYQRIIDRLRVSRYR